MSKRNAEIVPLLLGTDLNAYSMAKAFYDAFRVKSYAMGRYRDGLIAFSRIVKIEFCSGCKDEDVFLPELFSFAKRHKGKHLILVPCADTYAMLIAKNAKALSEYYKFIVPDEELVLRLTDRRELFGIANEYGLQFPKTTVFDRFSAAKVLKDVPYPATLKPSNSIEYWRCPFPGMKAVYCPKNEGEAFSVSEKIYSSGYSASLVIQERIFNSEIYTYTVFITESGICDFGVFGRAFIREGEKSPCKNHLAIMTFPENDVCKSLKFFLRSIGYRGFANIDLAKVGDEFYILELNAVQGRSCDYILASGINIAERLVLAINSSRKEMPRCYNRVLWHLTKKRAIVGLADCHIKKDEIKSLSKKEKCSSALLYLPDFRFNPIRFFYVLVCWRRMNKPYKKHIL